MVRLIMQVHTHLQKYTEPVELCLTQGSSASENENKLF